MSLGSGMGHFVDVCAKKAAPILGKAVAVTRLTTPVERAVAYMNILIGKGSGTGWDKGETAVAIRCIQSNDPIVIDVGGNTGEWTRDVQQGVGAKGRWIIVEPADEACAAIRALNLKNTEVVHCALSDHVGTMTLHTPGHCSGFASLHPRADTFVDGVKFEERTVPVTTLDLLLEERGIERVDFLKLDIEGHELWVLKGAQKALSVGKIKALSFEFGSGNINSRTYFRDFWNLLTEARFSIWRIPPGGTLVRIHRYYEDLEMFRGVSNYLAIRS